MLSKKEKITILQCFLQTIDNGHDVVYRRLRLDRDLLRWMFVTKRRLGDGDPTHGARRIW